VLPRIVQGLGTDVEVRQRPRERGLVLKPTQRRQDIDICRPCLVSLKLVIGCVTCREILASKRYRVRSDRLGKSSDVADAHGEGSCPVYSGLSSPTPLFSCAVSAVQRDTSPFHDRLITGQALALSVLTFSNETRFWQGYPGRFCWHMSLNRQGGSA
jgi:hypothetical protein